MLKRVWIGSVICSTAVVALFSHPVAAQSVSDEQLATCAQIENPLQRLVCFDELAAGGDYKPQQAASKSQKSRADDFGKEHLKDNNDDGADKRYVEIVKKTKDPYGRWILQLDNGQRWQQTDSTTYQLPENADYYIERGILNSFYLGRSDLNGRIKVKRID
ncbi:hypothetical protein [Pseudidiomarina salinarum]|uniref:hypothetical protein n=1 Tax=Pseudidiomarina salinarum TaxID=435908 RepID=UPI00068B9DB8|nr:hypothetical protein [Pseudidiomarina salinarum]RUO69107.1 hypothetical protein CWI79_09350 [Pseudidiomarina salinarum]